MRLEGWSFQSHPLIKDTNEQPFEQVLRTKVSSTGASGPMKSEYVTLPVHQYVHQPKGSLEFCDVF